MSDRLSTITDDFLEMLKANGKEAGAELIGDINSIREYVAERMAYLSTCVDQAGFQEAVVAERDNIALVAAVKAADRGDEVDARFLALIQGALVIASRALVIA